MFDLPEDVSNKKFISNEPEEVINAVPNQIQEIDTKENLEEEKINHNKQIKQNQKKIILKIPKANINIGEISRKFIKVSKEKWKYFKEIQYPAIYAKFYDLYYFELVPYRPIDIALKVLIILTILIILIIVLIILMELLRLIF